MRAKLYTIQSLPTGKLSLMARPRGGDWLPDEARALREAGVDLLVSFLTPEEVKELELTEEETYCQQEHISFHTFPIPDLSIPPFSAPTFTFLESLHTALSQGKHIVLHCRQGIGRSGLIAASLLILNGLTSDHACHLLTQSRGYTVPETPQQRQWVEAFYQHFYLPS